jgi:hypothetical protein
MTGEQRNGKEIKGKDTDLLVHEALFRNLPGRKLQSG